MSGIWDHGKRAFYLGSLGVTSDANGRLRMLRGIGGRGAWTSATNTITTKRAAKTALTERGLPEAEADRAIRWALGSEPCDCRRCKEAA